MARPGDQVNLNVNRNFLPIGNFGALYQTSVKRLTSDCVFRVD